MRFTYPFFRNVMSITIVRSLNGRAPETFLMVSVPLSRLYRHNYSGKTDEWKEDFLLWSIKNLRTLNLEWYCSRSGTLEVMQIRIKDYPDSPINS
jgi:hypothetical protein